MLSPMKSSCRNSANPLIAKIQQLFSRDLASGILISWKLGGPERLKNQAQFGSRIDRFGRRQFGAEVLQDCIVRPVA